jgi:hypothetical protein
LRTTNRYVPGLKAEREGAVEAWKAGDQGGRRLGIAAWRSGEEDEEEDETQP